MGYDGKPLADQKRVAAYVVYGVFRLATCSAAGPPT